MRSPLSKVLLGLGMLAAVTVSAFFAIRLYFPPPIPFSEKQQAAVPALLANPLTQADAALAPVGTVVTPSGLFTFKPYLQLGAQAAPGASESLQLLWQTDADKADFTVDVSPAGLKQWRRVTAPISRPLNIPDAAPQRLWTAMLGGLAPGQLFDYQVSQKGKPVFVARTRARRPVGSPYRFVVFGDCSENSVGQKRIAFETALAQPDFVFITGDIVYTRGRASEYATKFFPIYNADKGGFDVGAPLLRSTLFLGVVGNHDTAYTPADTWSDGLAYFYYWSLSLNGPTLALNAASVPRIPSNPAAQAAVQTASGNAYPRMANYSFDYGNAHWTVVDSNAYVDVNDKVLHAWLEADLQKAQKATWRFVAFHHPGFHSATKHQGDQWMRLLSPLWERYHVDVVWSGHVHNYQRSYPLAFAPGLGADPHGLVPGKWTLDKAFDGQTVTRASHPIYIVTGGGGASLYDPSIEWHPATWQPFTVKYVAGEHSFSLADVRGKTLAVRQISETGKVIDRWTLTK